MHQLPSVPSLGPTGSPFLLPPTGSLAEGERADAPSAPQPNVSRGFSRPALFLATTVGVSVASLCPKGASEHETGNFLSVSLQIGPES